MTKKDEINLNIHDVIFRLGLEDSASVYKYVEQCISKIDYEFDLEDIEEKRLFVQTIYMIVQLYLEKER